MLGNDTILIILGATAIANLGLAAVIFFINSKAAANQLFAAWMLSLSCWALALGGFFTASDSMEATLWMRVAYAVAAVAVFCFWYFATQFPDPVPLRASLHLSNIAAVALFVASIMVTPLIVRGVDGFPWAEHVVISSLGWTIYAAYLLYFFLSAHALLFLKYRRATGPARVQLRYVVFSAFVGGEIFGVFFNLLLPSPIFRQWHYIWLGPLATTAILVPFVAYAVTKHNLFNIKGVVTEFFAATLIIFSIADVFAFRSYLELVVRAAFAVCVTIFGIVLISRVNAGEEQRRQLQILSGQLAEANEHLKELDATKSEFLSIASHELRTPMSIIKGYLSLTLEGAYGKVSPKLHEKVGQIYETNERLIQLISNLLNLSRIEKGKIEYASKQVDVSELAGQVVEMLSMKAKQQGLALAFEAAKEHVEAHADPDKLREVLVNLIDNAIKYSKRGTIRVEASRDAEKGVAVLTVKDEGIGMTEEEAKKVFEKFFRVKSAETAGVQGTGLGLYICATFVRGMGGDIWIAETAAGKGTTMAFTLPLGPPAAKAA